MLTSVVVPAHDRPDHLRVCLRSIMTQTLQPDQVVVSQDGANEAVTAAAREFGIEPAIHEPAIGQLANRRHAFSLANGEAVTMIDDDDALEPTFLDRLHAALVDHPECAFATSDHWFAGPDGTIDQTATDAASERFGRADMQTGTYEDVLERTLLSAPFALTSTMFRREQIAAFGFVPDYAGQTPDFAIMLELGLAGAAAAYIDERLAIYRVHPGQQTVTGRAENVRSRVACLAAAYDRAPTELRPVIARRYRESRLELAIALAHRGRRREALAALRQFGRFGWGLPNPRRLAALAALLVGVKRRLT